jgi:hypothetical protein
LSETTRYFQIGFRKCGTTSIAAFFNRNGIPCIHHDRGHLGCRMQQNLRQGAPLLAGYDEQYRAFANMEYYFADGYFEGYKLYRELMETYEDSRFILNTRDRESWIRSMMTHARRPGPFRQYPEYHRQKYGTTDWKVICDIWRGEWDEHHEKVQAEIPAERLLVFDIEKDDPRRLCEFAGLPADGARHYKQENPSLNGVGMVIARCTPLAVKRAIPRSVKWPIKRMLRRS